MIRVSADWWDALVSVTINTGRSHILFPYWSNWLLQVYLEYVH